MSKIKLPAEEILKMYQDGASLHEIAEHFGTYANKIYRLLKKITPIREKSEARKSAVKRGRATHPTEGRERTDEEKLKISQKLEDFYSKMDKIDYNNMIERAKERWNNMSPETHELMKRRSIASNRLASKEGSAVEKYTKDILTEAGYYVDYHKKNILSTNLEVDIFLPNDAIAIEIDGPSHRIPIFGEKTLQRQQRNDLEKDGILLDLGLVLIRVEYDRSNFGLGVKNKIKTTILDMVKKIKEKFPPKNKRLIKIKI